MTETDPQAYQKNLALYDKLLATHPEIERKGKTMPYLDLSYQYILSLKPKPTTKKKKKK